MAELTDVREESSPAAVAADATTLPLPPRTPSWFRLPRKRRRAPSADAETEAEAAAQS